MSLDPELLRSSFELVLERAPDLTARFYVNLFERYPQARPLFGRRSGKEQEEMLAIALIAVVDHLEDPEWLQRTLGGLGARHADYGVTDEMYDWVGDALLVTLAQVGGDDWTDELAEAWTAAYVAIAGLMQAGSAAALARVA